MTTELVKYGAMSEASKAVGALFGSAYEVLSANGGVTGKVLRSGEASVVPSLSIEKVLEEHNLEIEGKERLVSNVCALLKKANLMIERAEGHIERQEKRIAQLEDIATTDELTSLKNRRGFFETFIREIDRCDRDVSKGGLLILIDLDNFKAVNDTYGHLAGDSCLRLVGRALQEEIRAMDIAARIGGDEFVLLLSNTTKCDALQRAQEIAVRLNNLAVAWHGEEIPVQASLGLQAFGAGDRVNKIFSDADTKLYAHKNRQKQERMNRA